jgi:alkylated DNA nucleotide flippase Atl1
VVNASGRCSTERLPDLPPGIQRRLLEAEGVDFGADDAVDLARYRWPVAPPAADLFADAGETEG